MFELEVDQRLDKLERLVSDLKQQQRAAELKDEAARRNAREAPPDYVSFAIARERRRHREGRSGIGHIPSRPCYDVERRTKDNDDFARNCFKHEQVHADAHLFLFVFLFALPASVHVSSHMISVCFQREGRT